MKGFRFFLPALTFGCLFENHLLLYLSRNYPYARSWKPNSAATRSADAVDNDSRAPARRSLQHRPTICPADLIFPRRKKFPRTKLLVLFSLPLRSGKIVT
jgi:hypothetical protein